MTNHLSVQLQAPSSTTINPFLLPPLFCKLLSLVPRENWGCYHPHLAECIEIWAHLRQNPWPPPLCLLSRAYPPSTDSQGAELVQTAPMYVHHNKVQAARLNIRHLHSVQNWQDCVAPTDPLVCLSVKCPLIAMIGHASSSNNSRTHPFLTLSHSFIKLFFRGISILGFLIAYRIFILGGLDGTTGCRITMVVWLQLCVLNMAAPSKQIAEHANMDHFNNHVKHIWLSKQLNYRPLI